MRRSVMTYALALSALAAMVLLRWYLDPVLHDSLPRATLFGAITFAIWLGGWRPAVLVCIAGSAITSCMFVDQRGTLFNKPGPAELPGLIAFLASAALTIVLGEAMRRSQYRFENLARNYEALLRSTTDDTTPHNTRNLLTRWSRAGFVLSLVVLVVGGALAYVNARQMELRGQRVVHTHDTIIGLETLLATIRDAETGQRGYLLTDNADFLVPYENAVGRVHDQVARLERLTADNPVQHARLKALEPGLAAKLEEMNNSILLQGRGDHAAALDHVRGGSGYLLMNDIRTAVGAMQQVEYRRLEQRAAESAASYRLVLISILLNTIVGISLLGAILFLHRRNVARQRSTLDLLEGQRERLRVTLASIGDGVITTDTRGVITYINPEGEQLTGWTSSEAMGLPIGQVFHLTDEQTGERVDDPVERSLREGVTASLTQHSILRARDGKERPIDDSAAPIRGGHGQLLGCVLVFRDIRDRRRLEQETLDRLAAARFLASMVESSNDGIISISLEGVILSWNAAARRLFQYTEEETVDKHISIILPDDRADEEEQFLKRLLRGERVEHFETVRVRRDGKPIHVSLTLSPIVDESGTIVGVSKTARDITDRKEAEERIYSLLTQLKTADRRKDEFLAMLAHELRGPLAPLHNMLELMKRSADDPQLLRAAHGTMERQLAQLVRLVDDLIEVSRITRDRIELRRERIDLALVIHQATETCDELARAAHHRVRLTLPAEPVIFDADPVRLAQVFGNILNNSCKYTPSGGEIRVTVERTADQATVTIADTGMGIPSDRLASIFGMFEQVDQTLGRSQGGLGIGLALVKRLVEMHGGTVEAFSEGEGLGSMFVVKLPLVIAAEGDSFAPAARAPASFTPRTILVVDDNKDSAQSLAMLLRVTGHTVHTVQDGIQAVESAESLRPEVILLDIGLPRLSGHEACRRIRQAPWGRSMLVIAMTGWGQEDDRRKSQQAGFDHHMVKPADFVLLTKLLEELPPRLKSQAAVQS